MRLNIFLQKQVTCQEKYKIASCHEDVAGKKSTNVQNFLL